MKAVIVIFLTVLLLGGCGKNNDDSEAYSEASMTIETQTEEKTVPVIVRGETEAMTTEAMTETELNTESEIESETETEPASIADTNMGQGTGAVVDVSQVVSNISVATNSNENANVALGIDVSRYQGTIDWKQVADAGISFAMIRVGYRTDATREINADSNAKYNMQEAQKNDIKVGVYFYSTATTEQEAVEEAKWVTNYVSQYKITYPVAYDCESYKSSSSVTYNLSATKRTDIALAFLNQVSSDGYTPMFYASSSELTYDWETSRISGKYKIWVSQYPNNPFPQTSSSSYTGVHAMWQYTNNGTIAGIIKPVDVNVAYFGYNEVNEAHNSDTPDEVGADVEALMNFTEVNEAVTAKDRTNLRDKPSQGSDSNVVYTLTNGETVLRTGVSSSGWSRVIFNNQTCYAVSNYLTTDLSTPQASVQDSSQADTSGTGDGLKTKFTDCSDIVTAKIEVNLRALPSVTNPDAVVVATLHNGEYITRTGINTQYGWSRVDYNGQTLYCVSSYLMTQ